MAEARVLSAAASAAAARVATTEVSWAALEEMVAVLLGEMMVVVEVTMTCNLQEVDTVEVEMVAEVAEAEEEVAIVDP